MLISPLILNKTISNFVNMYMTWQRTMPSKKHMFSWTLLVSQVVGSPLSTQPTPIVHPKSYQRPHFMHNKHNHSLMIGLYLLELMLGKNIALWALQMSVFHDTTFSGLCIIMIINHIKIIIITKIRPNLSFPSIHMIGGVPQAILPACLCTIIHQDQFTCTNFA